MVAIFTGLGAGFAHGSAANLGGVGLLGSASLGRAGEGVSVNAETGNLVLTQQDEFLAGLGLDAGVARTYNSAGALDENGDNWRQSTDRRMILAGTVNSAGSTVTQVLADGATVSWSWNGSAYTSTDLAAEDQTLSYASSTWTWRDNRGHMTETYGSDGYITSRADDDGNTLSYTYASTGKLDKLTTQDGSYIQYSWSGSDITQIVTHYTDLTISTAKTLTRTSYAYDAQHRLISVTVDLSPEDNSVADGKLYTTTYTYQGTTDLVASITQTDGSSLAISYDGSNRVSQLVLTAASGDTRTTTIAYYSDHAEITDPRNLVTKVYFAVSTSGAIGEMTKVIAPPATTGATGQTVQYAYDAAGHLTQITDALGKITTYTYDANGNVATITDPNSVLTTKSYDSNNNLTLVTITGSTASSASTSLYTRYVYDGENHLRYTISAEGRVTEYRYSAAGLLTDTITYPNNSFAIGSAAQTETQMNTWRDAISDRSSCQVQHFGYDARGNLIHSYAYGIADASGAGLTSEGYGETLYVYDQAGRLLQRQTTPQNPIVYVYDGLGRVIASTDMNNATTAFVFDDASDTTKVITLASYNVTTHAWDATAASYVNVSAYNKAGELLSKTDVVSGQNTHTTTGTQHFVYDKDGNLRAITDATAKSAYILYDKAGRKIADIGADGALTEYKYDADNRLIATVSYNTLLNSTDLAAIAAAPAADYEFGVNLTRPTGTDTDVWSWTVYDAGGRVAETIAGDGSAVAYVYDGANRLIKTTAYANKLASTQVSAFIATPPTTVTLPTADASHDVVTRSFYDGDGKLVGALNGEGYLSQILYDQAGRKVQTIAYANATVVANRASGTFSTLVSGLANAADDISTHFVYDGQGLLRFTIDALGHVTELVYRTGSASADANGQVRETIAYAAALGAVSDYGYTNIKSLVSPLASATNDRASYAVYDSAGRLAYSVDATGALVAYWYDSAGRVIKTTAYTTLYTSGNGATTLSGLSDASWQSTIATWLSTHTSATNDRITRSYYSERGELLYSVDGEGYVTGYVYDAEGRLTTQNRYATALSLSDASTVDTVINASKGAVTATTYTYDADGRLYDSYDPLGTHTRRTYWANGLLQDVMVAQGQGRDETKTRTVYDQAGHQVMVTSAQGYTESSSTTYAYDGLGNVASITDGDGNATTFSYDKAGHVLTKTQSPDGTTQYVTSYQYDAFGNVITTTDARGNASSAIYDQDNRIIEAIDAEGFHTRTSYTAFGEVAQVVRFINRDIDLYDTTYLAGGTGLTFTQEAVSTGGTATVARNSHGEIPAWDSNHYAWGGNVAVLNGDRSDGKTTIAAGDTVSFSFQAKALASGVTLFARLTYQLADGSLAYGGPSVTITDPNWSTFTASGTAPANAVAMYLEVFTYRTDANVNGAFDFEMRTVKVTRTPASGSSTTNISGPHVWDSVTTFAYDKLGRLTQTTDANGASESYALNAFGQRTSFTNKLGATSTYTYDKRGLLKTQVDPITAKRSDGTTEASSVTTTYAYDSRGNRTQMVEASGLSEQRTTNYSYDAADRLISQSGDAISVATSATASLSTVTPTTTYAYDRRGNVIQTTVSLGGTSTASTLYWYDKLDRVTEEVSPLGTVTTFTYDDNGNVLEKRIYATQVTPPADATGTAPAPTGSYRSTQYVYDDLNRVIQVKTPSIEIASYTTAFTVATQTLITTYMYDAMGNVVRTTDANGNMTWDYYDKVGNKTTEVDPLNFKTIWGYDTNHNVVTEKRYAIALPSAPTSTLSPPTGQVADAVNDRLTTFTYDKMGRRLTEVRSNVAVNNAASPGATTNVSATITYTYNALGEVASKTEATGETTTYTYDTMGRMTSEAHASFTDVNGNTVTPTLTYAYDGLGDLVRTVDAGAAGTISASDRITTSSYNAAGELISSTDASGFVHTYRYDAAGRLVRDEYTRQKADGTTAHEAIGTDYDLEGHVIRQGVMVDTDSGSSDVWSRAGAGLDTIAMSYNAFGEMAQRGYFHDISGAQTTLYDESFTYDDAGRLWATTGGDGTSKYFMYDANGNQTLMVASSGADIAGKANINAVLALWSSNAAVATTYVSGVVATITRYDVRNQAIEVKEPQRELSSTTKANLSTTRGYNAFGEVAYETDANGNRIDYTYNTMGRLIKTQMPLVQGVGENGLYITGYDASFNPTATSATATTFHPLEYRYYDAAGRLVAQRDANGKLTQYSYLAGSGYGQSQGLITQTKTADNATVNTLYDIHGDARIVRDQLWTSGTNHQDSQSFDGMGRLTSLTHSGGLVDTYQYDGLGQRIKHWNSLLGSGNAETTTFDQEGRIIQAVAMGGDTTSNAYAWDATIADMGITFGGWTQTTTVANGKTKIENDDAFDRMVSTTDMAGNVTTSTYDKAGRAISRAGGVTQYYNFFNTGRLSEAYSSGGAYGAYYHHGAGVDAIYYRGTTFSYDQVGNLLTQTLREVGDFIGNPQRDPETGQMVTPDPEPIDRIMTDETATYDALNRIVTWNEVGVTNLGNEKLPNASHNFVYDADGNIRRSTATYYALDSQGTAASSASTQDYWYKYDALNRMTTSQGVLSGGAISRGTGGVDIFYDNAGNRAYTIAMVSGVAKREDYTYDAANRVTQIKSGTTLTAPNTLRSDFTYDLMGRLTLQHDYATNGTSVVYSDSRTLNTKGQVTSESVSTVKGSTTYLASSTYTYGSGSTYALGSPLTITTVNYENGVQKKTNLTTNGYLWSDGPLQSTIDYTPDTSVPGTVNHTVYNYDRIGGQYQLGQIVITDGRPRTVQFRNDFMGQGVRRDEKDSLSGGDPHEFWYRFSGREMVYVGNNGTVDTDEATSVTNRTATQGTGAFFNGASSGTSFADSDLAYDSIDSYDQGSTGGMYTVRDGDTLAGIATSLWGDSSLWYKIAELNGLTADSALPEGMPLLIPVGVIRSTNNATTYKPYDPAEIAGNTMPTAVKPPKSKHNCGVFGQIVMVVIAAVVAFYTAGAAAQFFAGAMNLTTGTTAAAIATGSVADIAGASLATLEAAGAGAAVGGAVGSIVSQAVGVATGIQDKFSWNAVGLAAIGAAAGVATAKVIPGTSNFAAAERGMANSAITQGIGVATGMQSKFSWAGVAAAGIGSAVGNEFRHDFGDGITDALAGDPSSQNYGTNFASAQIATSGIVAMTDAIAGAASRTLINGTDFGDNVLAALPDAIGSTIGNALALAIKNNVLVRSAANQKKVDVGTTDGGVKNFASSSELGGDSGGLVSDLTFNGDTGGLWVEAQQASEDTASGALERYAPQYADPDRARQADEAGGRYQHGVLEGLWTDLGGILTLDPFYGEEFDYAYPSTSAEQSQGRMDGALVGQLLTLGLAARAGAGAAGESEIGAESALTPRVNVADQFSVKIRPDGSRSYRYLNPDRGHGLEMYIKDGVLGLDVRASENASLGSGTDMVLSGMQRLHTDGVEVTAIRGFWLRNSDSVNYQEFVDNLGDMTPQQAAANTWTGRLAARMGYTEVSTPQISYGAHVAGLPNTPSTVTVLFRKP